MQFPIKTIFSWIDTELTKEDISKFFDDLHPYMAFAGAWNELELSISTKNDILCFTGTSLKMDSRNGHKRLHIGNYFSERAKSEIEKHTTGIEIRFMR